MYALIDISNQMLEDSAFDHAGASLRKAGLAVAINEMLKRRSVAEWLRRGPVAGCEMRVRNSRHGSGVGQLLPPPCRRRPRPAEQAFDLSRPGANIPAAVSEPPLVCRPRTSNCAFVNSATRSAPGAAHTKRPWFRRRAAHHTPKPSCTSSFSRVPRALAKR